MDALIIIAPFGILILNVCSEQSGGNKLMLVALDNFSTKKNRCKSEHIETKIWLMRWQFNINCIFLRRSLKNGQT